MAVVAVVGSGMAGTPGISARVFSSLAEGRVNVMAIAQGSSELNISFAVDADQAGEAARRVHAAFQLSKIGGGRSVEAAHSDVVLLGFGRVGRALADQIGAQDGGCRCAWWACSTARATSSIPRAFRRDASRGSPRARTAAVCSPSLGGERAAAAAALHFIASHAVSRPILVDVTAEETGDLLRVALGQGFDLVLANKKPLAGTAESYVRLLEAAQAASRRIRYEATVGAGLPVLDTCRKLMESGDRILRIEGAVSGTLGFVLSAVSEGRRFSEAVREAMDRGYTEPDPRDDLSGRDVARKGLILARLLGYPGGLPERRGPHAEGPARRVPRRVPEAPAGVRRRVAGRAWLARAAGAGCFATPSPPLPRRTRRAHGGAASARPWALSRAPAT